MNRFLLFTLTFSASLFAHYAHAQSSAELSCKAQAKEVAVQTYSSCITEARNSQIEQIRKSYKDDLNALKSKYSSQLKKMNGKSSSKRGKAALTAQEVAPLTKTEKSVAAMDRKLPVKTQHNEAIPVQTLVDSPTIVPVENSPSPVTKEISDADSGSVEVIDMPTPDEAPAT